MLYLPNVLPLFNNISKAHNQHIFNYWLLCKKLSKAKCTNSWYQSKLASTDVKRIENFYTFSRKCYVLRKILESYWHWILFVCLRWFSNIISINFQKSVLGNKRGTVEMKKYQWYIALIWQWQSTLGVKLRWE